MDQDRIVLLSAALRGQGEFRRAIETVGVALPSFNSTYLVIAYRELFLAAAEGGFKDEARRYAEIALLLEPGFPSAANYLAAQRNDV